MKLSIIVPCLNEEKNISLFYQTLKEKLKISDYEIIFIDDGSKDQTFSEMKKLAHKNSHIKVIRFSKNFGKDAAIYAGLIKSTGNIISIIDGDLQQNPSYLNKMFDVLTTNDEYDQIVMIPTNENKKGLSRLGRKIFYRLIDSLSNTDFIAGASDFRMFRKNVSNAIIELSERNRFSKGLFSWIGFNTKKMTYTIEKRKHGKTKYNFKANFKYAIDAIFDFSPKPLRLATYLGVISSLLAFIYGTTLIITTLTQGVDVPGYASTLCIVLFLGGAQLLAIGILGEYLSRTYIEVKKRPIYIIKDDIGFNQTKK